MHRNSGRSAYRTLTLVVGFLAVVGTAACSMDSAGSLAPTSPTSLSGSLFALEGGDSCPAGTSTKVEGNESSLSYTNPTGVINQVCIKAGQTSGLVITADGSYDNTGAPGSCYTVAGLSTSTVSITKIGSGRSCQGLSHALFYTAATPPPPCEKDCEPPPCEKDCEPPPPCDPNKDPLCKP